MPAATLEKDGFDGDALHWEKNQPEKPPVKFPHYRFRPFPTCVYREWNETTRQNELYRAAASNMLDMNNPRDVAAAERMIGQYETKQIGVDDFDQTGQIVSALRESNERALEGALESGWANKPDEVKAATDRLNKRVALAAGERAYDDRRLSDTAKAEVEAVENVTEGHVVDVAESRREARESGALKGKR